LSEAPLYSSFVRGELSRLQRKRGGNRKRKRGAEREREREGQRGREKESEG